MPAEDMKFILPLFELKPIEHSYYVATTSLKNITHEARLLNYN